MMQAGFRNMAKRIDEAQERFVAFAMASAGVSRVEAERAFVVMRRAKVLTIDVVGGQFSFVHGAFAEADVIRRASAR